VVDRGKPIRNTTHITGKLIRNLKFKIVELPRHCPPVISIEIGGRNGKAFRIEEGTIECFELRNTGTNLSRVFTLSKLNFDDEDVGRAV